ncbi:MAG: DUF5678 domain-containing protein [Patescibacteria group bacterium]
MSKDWTEIYRKYKGLWVALAEDEETVISFHRIARQALEQAKSKGCKNPILTRVPEDLKTFVGSL